MAEDQKVRKRTSRPSDKIKIGRKHVRELKRIVKKCGWPKISLFGEKEVEAAWLIAQHADFDSLFQKLCLKLIVKEAKRGEALKRHIAYLTDRILVNRSKPQLFGTQFRKSKDGNMEPYPIKGRETLAKRRREYGLPSMKKYSAIINKLNNGIDGIKPHQN